MNLVPCPYTPLLCIDKILTSYEWFQPLEALNGQTILDFNVNDINMVKDLFENEK